MTINGGNVGDKPRRDTKKTLNSQKAEQTVVCVGYLCRQNMNKFYVCLRRQRLRHLCQNTILSSAKHLTNVEI